MPTLQDILDQLENDSELESMEKEAMEPMGVPMPAAGGTGGMGTSEEVEMYEANSNAAGQMVTDAVGNTMSDNEADARVKVQAQMEAMAAKQNEAKAMAEVDELPGAAQRTIMGEQLALGDTQKLSEARLERLLELGLEKEADIMHEKLAEDNYVLGQIFGRGFNDFVEGNDSAMAKEASALDQIAECTEEERTQILDGLTDTEVEKVAELLEEKNEWEKTAGDWYELGRAFAQGMVDETQS